MTVTKNRQTNDTVLRMAKAAFPNKRVILRRFKQAVLDRISAWNDHIAWHSRNQKITLSDVRVLLIIG